VYTPAQQAFDYYRKSEPIAPITLFKGAQPCTDIRTIRKSLFEKHLRGRNDFKGMMQEALKPDLDPRIGFLQQLEKSLGVSLKYTGTSPSQENFRGIFSDIDLATDSQPQYERIIKTARTLGYHLQEKALYTEIPELDFLVWKPVEMINTIDILDPAVYDDQVVFITGQAAHKYSQSLGYVEKAIPALLRPYDMGEGVELYSRMITGYKSAFRLMKLADITEITVGSNPISGEGPIQRKQLEDFIKMRTSPEDFGLHLAGDDPRRIESIVQHQKVLFKILQSLNSSMNHEVYWVPFRAAQDHAHRQIDMLDQQKQEGLIDEAEHRQQTDEVWAEDRNLRRDIDNTIQRERIRFHALWKKYPPEIIRRLYFSEEEIREMKLGYLDHLYWQFGLPGTGTTN
jgi:hypothetical protein